MMWEGGESAAGGGGCAGSTSSGRRKPSWRERENNRRRERRRRAIAAKIYAGLRAQGNYNLPKHCDNNEVLKALCAEAGWIVEPDGTTYRKGRKPSSSPIPMEIGGTSTNITPGSSCNPSPPSSYFATPIPSYQVSPLSSACPSPTRGGGSGDNNSSYPFAFLHSGITSSLPALRISNSAPVTPPLSSPTRNKQTFNLQTLAQQSMSAFNVSNYFASAPSSPTRGQRFPATIPECDESDTSTIDSGQWMSFQKYAPNSPTFNLVKPAPPTAPTHQGGPSRGDGFLFNEEGKMMSMDFDFEKVAMKAWEGERIHEVGLDDLELKLGSSRTCSS